MNRSQVDFWFRLSSADIAGDIKIVVVLFNLLHADAPGVALNSIRALLVGVNNFVNMLRQQLILSLPFFEMLGGINKKYVIWLLAFFQH